METEPFRWPNEFLLTVLVLQVLAIIVPWLPFVRRQHAGVAMSPPLIATLAWLAYEMYLGAVAPSGHTLIRIDLFLLAPLGVNAWVSAAVSLIYQKR